MLAITESKIDLGGKVSQSDIINNIQAGHEDVIYLASEKQMISLIGAGKLSEDYFSYWMDCQEEMRIAMNEF